MLGDLPVTADDRVLVDYRTSDDAGVFRVDETRALVQTVDFFTPIVDDPGTYGRIAAANALSDIYAMGGRPLTALAIAGFPRSGDREVLRAIFVGGLETLREAGVALLGGHTVQDAEVKFGYAVTGEIDPHAIWTNAGAQPEDVLILTKAIGTGVIATALKFGRAPATAVDAATRAMTMLNRAASEVLHRLPPDAVHACTDVTGFGLIGHASEMAAASGCRIRIEAARVPLLEGALALALDNVAGGARTNREYFEAGVAISRELPPDRLQLLFDPQTSGGLLAAVAPAHAAAALSALLSAGIAAASIGVVEPPGGSLLLVE